MVKITDILTKVLKPLGFQKKGASWYRYNNRLLVGVSFYKSRFSETGYIDLTLTLSEVSIEKPPADGWHASMRLTSLIQSGKHISEIIKKEVTEADATVLLSTLESEAIPLIQSLFDLNNVTEMVRQRKWITRSKFLERLEALPQKKTTIGP